MNPSRDLIPTVVESTQAGERGFDIYSGLLRDRIVFLRQQIDDELARLVVAQLLFLQSEDPETDVHLYITSPGGSVTAGLAIHDTMRAISCDVTTTAMGMVASMATLLLAAGTPGKRSALPGATIHFHPAHGGVQGYGPDVEIQLRFMLDLQERGNRLLGDYTGQTYDQIRQDFQRDRFFTAQQAVEYGLVDRLITAAAAASHRHP